MSNMKLKRSINLLTITLSLFLNPVIGYTQQAKIAVSIEDIDNFWQAYDLIRQTNDPAQQLHYLQQNFITKGTPGLKAMGLARNYTSQSYLDAIRQYPKFWESIRSETLKAKTYAKAIEEGAQKLQRIYPEYQSSEVYFTIGALRSPGTTLGGKVLIGSELALANPQTVSSEFGENFSYLPSYFSSDPSKNIVFLNIHEVVHTQQKGTRGENLLSQCLYEGIAEFIPTIALNLPSPLPAIDYGKINLNRIKNTFSKEMFSPWFDRWLYNDLNNEFKTRDLGYFVGFSIAEKFYQSSSNKKQAIKELLNIDFNQIDLVEKFVDDTGFFSNKLAYYKQGFELQRPQVLGISEFKNKAQDVDPQHKVITIRFSQKMDPRYRSFGIGPLGESSLLKLKRFIGMADDGRAVSFEIDLVPNHHYQLLIEQGFRTDSGSPAKPYLIEFKTKDLSKR